MQPASFGVLLRRARIAAGLTQEELAERAHISSRSIGDIERGVSRAPRRDTVALLAEALDLAPHDRPPFEAAARHLDDRSLSQSARRHRSGAASPPLFVGRARELLLLDQHLAGAGPPLLLLAGEPGIGKSSILAKAVQRAEAAGWRVLKGGCQRRGGQEPYAPVLGALKSHLEHLSHAALSSSLHGCAWLVRMLPELAGGPIDPLPSWIVPPEQERRLMFDAVTRFLANVAGPAGTLLVLDDLQWAGSDALDLVTALLRSAAEVRLRVVGAYRDTEVQPPDALSVALVDLAHAGLAAHHTLAPLAVEEAGQLLDGILDGVNEAEQTERATLRTRVLQRAGGIPFFVVSYAQWLRLDDQGREDNAMPWDVAHSLRQRVATLPEDARAVLSLAAIVGREVPTALLVAAAARAEEDVVAALEAACRVRLLIEDAHGCRFAHDVIREVVERTSVWHDASCCTGASRWPSRRHMPTGYPSTMRCWLSITGRVRPGRKPSSIW